MDFYSAGRWFESLRARQFIQMNQKHRAQLVATQQFLAKDFS
jgi:hypothetical protein